MPPSPSLSILMAKMTYFTDVIIINVHTISDSTPSTTAGVGVPEFMLSTVLSVYSGLVPISPNTIPSAARPNVARPHLRTVVVAPECALLVASWFIRGKGLGGWMQVGGVVLAMTERVDARHFTLKLRSSESYFHSKS